MQFHDCETVSAFIYSAIFQLVFVLISTISTEAGLSQSLRSTNFEAFIILREVALTKYLRNLNLNTLVNKILYLAYLVTF